MIPENEFAMWGPLRPSVARVWRALYPDVSPLMFAKELTAAVEADDLVLEVGAGAGEIYPHKLRGRVKRLVGIDPDTRVTSNPHLDEGHVGFCEQMPFPDATFDVAFHRMLAEHLADPQCATKEIGRVLKPGGLLIFHTPNRWHYSMVISRFTPMWFHRAFMRLLKTRPDSRDVHFAHYRINTKRQITRILDASGFDLVKLTYVTMPPGYLRFSLPAFLLGVAFERTVERMVPALRPTLLVVARRHR